MKTLYQGSENAPEMENSVHKAGMSHLELNTRIVYNLYIF